MKKSDRIIKFLKKYNLENNGTAYGELYLLIEAVRHKSTQRLKLRGGD
jgi:hypothetical protein